MPTNMDKPPPPPQAPSTTTASSSSSSSAAVASSSSSSSSSNQNQNQSRSTTASLKSRMTSNKDKDKDRDRDRDTTASSSSSSSQQHITTTTILKDPQALLEGWLKKRGTRMPGHWSERYFVLKGDQLVYYIKPTDVDARGAYVLDRTCVVSEVKPYTTAYDKKKVLYAFRIVWPEAVELSEMSSSASASASAASAAAAAQENEEGKEGKEKNAGAGGEKRHSGRMAAPNVVATTAPTTASSTKSTTSTTTGTTDVVMQRRSQAIDRSFADVGMDPYLQSSYIPPSQQQQQQQQQQHQGTHTHTKVIRSVSSLRMMESGSGGSGSMRRLGSGSTGSSGGGSGSSGQLVQRSSSGTSTLATGGAMVAMAVGGVVAGAVTAGLGLVAPMVIVGITAATGSGAAVYGAASSSHSGGLKTKQVALVLAMENKDNAEEWRAAIEAQIRWSQGFPQSRWMSMVGLDRRMPQPSMNLSGGGGGGGNKKRRSGLPRGATAATKLEDVDRWTRLTRWRPWSVYNGVRIYELDRLPPGGKGGAGAAAPGAGVNTHTHTSTSASASGSNNKPRNPNILPCRKVQVAVRGTPLETFIALVSIPCRVLNGVVESVRMVERLDDQSEVIHLTLKPLFLWPTWTAPRDFCLVRYWRYDEDGTYIICFDSTTHRACPPLPGYVRGDMHAVYTISPKKHMRGGNSVEFDDAPECLLTYILQVDPRGWIWQVGGYLDRFVTEMLCLVLDVRDLLETDRFMAVHVDTRGDEGVGGGGKEGEGEEAGGGGGAGGGGRRESVGGKGGGGGRQKGTLELHRATVPPEMWGDVDATTFVVRGPNYASSKLKVPSDKAAFRLLACDLFDLPEAKENIAGHPNNRVQAALTKGDSPPFIFVVQLQIPGVDSQLGYVSYFAPDEGMSIFDQDTPLARVLKPFFFGPDDTYRDLRFKLIPKIVEGNWVVRKSVGSTPAILGTKLKQTYHRGVNYFELDVNIASSSVAAGVVRLAAGYAKTLVVDLALVIQGESEEELPERVVAAWRINEMDLGTAKKLE